MKIHRFLFLIQIFVFPFIVFGSEPITITDQTIKLNGEKEYHFGFLEGDEIIFDLEIVKGKNVKEVEIVEYPSTSKFSDFKTTAISSKKIKVQKTAVYVFRIKGGGLGTKVCKVKILRIPKNEEAIDFDTSVEWKTERDSIYTEKVRKKLIRQDTALVSIVDRTERVHSQTNLSNSNRSDFSVDLPSNKYSELSTSEVISWSYWIGVGDEGLEQFEADKKRYLLESTSTVSTLINPMAGLALGGFAMLTNQPKGDNVQYWFSAQLNGQPITLAEGNSVVSSGRNTDALQGSFTVILENDNLTDGINVNIKIAALMVTKTFENEKYQELSVTETTYPVVKLQH